MGKNHIADAETEFIAVNVTPDFCVVEGQVVPFDIYQELSSEKSAYAGTVSARGEKVLKVGSVIAGVIGNAGAGVLSGTSLAGGDVLVADGSSTVTVEGQAVARNDDLVLMNG